MIFASFNNHVSTEGSARSAMRGSRGSQLLNPCAQPWVYSTKCTHCEPRSLSRLRFPPKILLSDVSFVPACQIYTSLLFWYSWMLMVLFSLIRMVRTVSQNCTEKSTSSSHQSLANTARKQGPSLSSPWNVSTLWSHTFFYFQHNGIYTLYSTSRFSKTGSTASYGIDSMNQLYIASCSSARIIDVTQEINDNRNISQSSNSLSLYLRFLPSSTDYHVSERTYARDLEESQNTYTIYHDVQKKIFCKLRTSSSNAPYACKNRSSCLRCLAINSCRKQHSANWEAHNTQINKSCFLRGTNSGLAGSMLQVTLSS